MGRCCVSFNGEEWVEVADVCDTEFGSDSSEYRDAGEGVEDDEGEVVRSGEIDRDIVLGGECVIFRVEVGLLERSAGGRHKATYGEKKEGGLFHPFYIWFATCSQVI